MLSPSWLLSQWKFKRRLAGSDTIDRVTEWREMSLDHCVNVNPYKATWSSEESEDYTKYDRNSIPGRRFYCNIATDIEDIAQNVASSPAQLAMDRGSTLAQIELNTDKHAFVILDEIEAPAFSSTFDLLRDPENAANSVKISLALTFFRSHGTQHLEDGDAHTALRSFLNALRLEEAGLGAPRHETWAAVSDCLARLGAVKGALKEYLSLAVQCRSDGRHSMAADAFERAGLLMVAGKSKKPMTIGKESFTAFRCFREARLYYALVGDQQSSSRAYVLERDAETRVTRSWGRKAVLMLMRFVWLFGESPVRAVRSFALMWVSYGLVYHLFESYQCGGRAHTWMNSFYFSATTITTLGYGDCTPLDGIATLLAGTEAFFGLISSAMIIVAIQRRFASG